MAAHACKNKVGPIVGIKAPLAPPAPVMPALALWIAKPRCTCTQSQAYIDRLMQAVAVAELMLALLLPEAVESKTETEKGQK